MLSLAGNGNLMKTYILLTNCLQSINLLSKDSLHKTIWMLDKALFRQICETSFSPDIDLADTAANTQLNRQKCLCL